MNTIFFTEFCSKMECTYQFQSDLQHANKVSLSHQYPLALKVFCRNFRLHGKFNPSYNPLPSLFVFPPTTESLSHLVIIISQSPWTSCWNLYHQHTFSCSYTAKWIGRLGQFVPMFMLNILNLNKLKREIVTRHAACLLSTDYSGMMKQWGTFWMFLTSAENNGFGVQHWCCVIHMWSRQAFVHILDSTKH